MTWHLKDREVEKALIKLCPYFVDRLNWGVSSKEMGKEYVYVSFDRTMNDWVIDDCELMFWMEELEDIPEYRTDKWNEYPKVTPPENVLMRLEIFRTDFCQSQHTYRYAAVFLKGNWLSNNETIEIKKTDEVCFRPWEN